MSMRPNSRKKRSDCFESELRKLYDITKMLKEEGKSDGECRYKELIATILLFIDTSLHDIGIALYILLGFVISKFISGLF